MKSVEHSLDYAGAIRLSEGEEEKKRLTVNIWLTLACNTSIWRVMTPREKAATYPNDTEGHNKRATNIIR